MELPRKFLASRSSPRPSNAPLPSTQISVYKFINPFHSKYSHFKSEFKSYYQVRNHILRLFKTLPLKKKENIAKREQKLSTAGKGKAVTFVEMAILRKIFYPNISSSIKKEYPWLVEPLSKKNKTEKMTKHDFNVLMISLVLFTIKELGFETIILKSRNTEMLYVKVLVSEEILKFYARGLSTRLKLKKHKTWIKGFQKVSPYAPMWVGEESEIPLEQIFVSYDVNSREHEKGSLFTFTDKYRIARGVLAHKMDLHILKSFDLLETNFIPSEPQLLLELKIEWATFSKLFAPQPISKIKTYFSEQIAFYFCWLETYKNFMVIAAAFGTIVFISEIFCYYTDHNLVALSFKIAFCLFVAVWATCFERYWIRKEKHLAWEWGTINLGEQQIQREEFEGVYDKDEVSGKIKVIRTGKTRHLSIRIFSFGSILLFVAVVIVIVVSIFRLRVNLLMDDKWKKYGALITAIVYAIQINVFDVIYTKVAQLLTNWENHETMNEYNNYLALKLFMFRFVNSYSGLFYIAFFKEYFEGKCGFEECMNELGFQLTVIFITNMVLNVIELGLPWVLYKSREKLESFRLKSRESLRENLYQVEIESQLEPYDYAIEDYMEMCLQYGFIALFGASYPLITILALIEIIIEIRVDALKLCKFVRRPEPVKCEDIGIWKKLIRFISVFGVFTNSGIIIITSGLLDSYEWTHKFTIFVVLEHCLMLVMVMIRYLIPDCPSEVVKAQKWALRVVNGLLAGKNVEEVNPEFISQSSVERNFFLRQEDIKIYE